MSTTDGDQQQDLTRKQRREQARADRKAAEQAVAADAARRRRLTQLGGAVVVVVVAIVVILLATGSGGKKTITVKPGVKNSGNEKAIREVKAELEGIPQKGNVLGNPTAPVTLQYFGDLECPVCQSFTLGALPKLIEKWVKPGKLRIEYRNLETATREPEVFRNQQTAAMAAGKQNKGWYYIELFYHEQGEESSGYVTEAYLQGLAQQVPGLNLAKWSADRADQSFQAQLATDTQESNNNGLTGTPAFLIGRTGGAMTKFEYASLTDPASFNEAIEKLLKA
jgi:protein-disulfide isomerase